MTAFLAALPAFLVALPKLLELMVMFMNSVQKIVAWAEKNNVRKWLESVEGAIDDLNKAQTSEEKSNAASNLSNLLRSF